MNRSERESLFKNFILFFALLEILLTFIFFFFFEDKKKDIYELLLSRMQVCSFTLQCNEFTYDFYPRSSKVLVNKLYPSKNEIYALFPLPTSKKYYLKVSYSNQQLQNEIEQLFFNIVTMFIFASVVILFVSFVLTLYTLKPIRQALKINQEFIKDILHDFNTPISAMILNLELLKKECNSPLLLRLQKSIDTIVSLQDNLRIFLKNIKEGKQEVHCNKLLRDRVNYFKALYPKLHFKIIEKSDLILLTQKELLTRIFDNLLSNACKYNKKNGSITIIVERRKVIIEDTGKGIKNSKRVFDRFYKEHDRGIGIGLSIVKKLCEELDIKIDIESEIGKGTKVVLEFNENDLL